MSKAALHSAALKKIIARMIKSAPAKLPEPCEPMARLIRAFLEYDCDAARAESAEKKVMGSMVDYNELRVTPAVELAALLGVRYPFADVRCSALHRTLQSIFDREHHMHLERLKEMKKAEVRSYLQSLHGIVPYVEAVVSLECFEAAAAPVDTKLLLYMIGKEAVAPECDIPTLQSTLERHIKASDMLAFHAAVRKELDDFTPRVWPLPPKPAAVEPPPAPVVALEPVEERPAKTAAKAARHEVAKPPKPPRAPAAPARKSRLKT